MKNNTTRESNINLPVTYYGVFKQAYKINFVFLMKLSLLIFIFFIPTFVWIYINSILEGSVLAKFDDTNTKWIALLQYRQTFVWLIIPCFTIASIGLSGGFYVINRYIHNEGVVLIPDFFQGIRRNCSRFILLALFYSAIISFLYYVAFLFCRPEDAVIYTSILVFDIIMSFILTMSMIYAMQLSLVYDSRYFEVIKKGFILSFIELGRNLLAFLSTITLFFISYTINNYLFPQYPVLIWITFSIYAVLGLGHSVLVFSLFSAYAFDKYINRTLFPEIYRLGLYNPDTKDEKK